MATTPVATINPQRVTRLLQDELGDTPYNRGHIFGQTINTVADDNGTPYSWTFYATEFNGYEEPDTNTRIQLTWGVIPGQFMVVETDTYTHSTDSYAMDVAELEDLVTEVRYSLEDYYQARQRMCALGL